MRARLDELADMLGDGEVTRQQYARQRERIEGKLDPDEQSPSPSSTNGKAMLHVTSGHAPGHIRNEFETLAEDRSAWPSPRCAG